MAVESADLRDGPSPVGRLARALSAASAVITPLEEDAAGLARRFPGLSRRVHPLCAGLRLGELPFAGPAGRPARIVAVDRLVAESGHADLIDACARLAGEGRRFECTIVGEGPLRGALLDRARRLGIHGLLALPGALAPDEVRRLVAGAAVLAAPAVASTGGGPAPVMLQAMALGTPCVATAAPAVPGALIEGATGLRVPEHDPGALGAAVGRLLHDPELRERLAAAARSRVEASFDLERNMARWREIVLGTGGRRRGAPTTRKDGARAPGPAVEVSSPGR